MNEIRFEQLLSRYGAEISVWPNETRAAAMVFSKTPQGKEMLDAEKQLDTLFSDRLVVDANPEGFLSRLDAIPQQYKQEVAVKSGFIKCIQAFWALFDVELSPAIITSQMAAVAIVLCMGVMVGFNNNNSSRISGDELVTEIDISEVWFTDLSDNEPITEFVGE